MGLTGVDPNNPLAAERREFVPGAGVASVGASSRPILLFGPRTLSGTETLDTVGDPIEDEADAITRFGARALLRWMYKLCAGVARGAQINAIAVTEDAGAAAATRTFTFATAATGDTTCFIDWGGETASFSVRTGDTAIEQAAAAAAAINAASDSSWPMTAAVGGAGSEHIVTITSSCTGPDGLLITDRVRTRYLRFVGTTITAGTSAGGTGTHDFTAAYTAANAVDFYYHVSSQTTTSAPTATDNGVGEHIKLIKDLVAPTGGKEAVGIFGLVGTQAQATTVATASAANSAYVHFFHEINSPWHPGMLAAYHAGVLWFTQISHPAYNLNEYSNTDTTPYNVPAPYDRGDWLTEAEMIADANNGVCPVGRRKNGDAVLKRFVTSRSLNGAGGTDYRARPGAVPSVLFFFWQTLAARWASQRQQFIDDDPPAGTFPKPNVSTPRDLLGVTQKLINDLTEGNPLGQYNGPILAPSDLQAMLDSVVCTKVGARLNLEVNLFHITSYLGSDSTIREIGAGY